MHNDGTSDKYKEDRTGNQLMQDDEAKYFLASIINTLQDSIVTISLKGIITSWNKSAERLYGYPASEAIGQSLAMVTFPKEFAALSERIEAIRHGDTIPLYDTMRIHKGGGSIHIEVTLSPIMNYGGEVIGLSTVARDVTELRKMEEALVASESQLRAILEAAIDFAIITLDANGNIIDWSSGAHLMFGYEREEVLGKFCDLIFTPEDREANMAVIEIELARKTGRSIDERWHLHKDGTRFFMSGVMTPINTSNVSGFVKVARNITDRKLAEEALLLSEQQKSLAVQSAGMGEWAWDLISDAFTINEQVAVMMGLEQTSEPRPFNVLFQQIYAPDEPGFHAQLNLALEGLFIFQYEFRIVRADNHEVIWVNAYGRVVAHTNNRPSKMIGVIYDITSRKMLEKQKDDFISMASHELKTPVTAIKSYSEVLEESLAEAKDDVNLTLLRKLNVQIQRLVQLMQTLLDSSSVSEGILRLHPETFSLNELVEEYLHSVRTTFRSHRFRPQLNPVALLHADKARILQVISNLVTNAVKYSPEKTDIIITTEDKGEGLMLSVQDFGPGIPAESQPYLFDRYYRVPGKNNNYHEGFGLGLYICSQIIKQHHGSITVESVIGHGSTFSFALPYA
jgi:PAS domain S-box-containing protein